MKRFSVLFFAGIAAATASTQWEDKLPLPSRDLEWGDVNFIHTTDIHGELPDRGLKLEADSCLPKDGFWDTSM
jgi:2',3'-cyclic-nucleotide 2'-phosphodiesterase (5'-nucleotidase family)